MRFIQFFLFAVLVPTVASAAPYDVERPSTPNILSYSNSPEDFRDVARDMYEVLESRPCVGLHDVDWGASLKLEYESVAQLERDFSKSPAGSHLAIAKDDGAYEHAISVEQGKCWWDSQSNDPRKHIEYIERKVRADIVELRQMSLLVNEQPAVDFLGNAAEFRYSVRRLIEFYHSLCPWTSLADNSEIFIRGLAELRKFELRLGGTPWLNQYEVAKEDAIYRQARMIPECAEPDPTPVSELSDEVLATTKERIEEFEELKRF